MGKSFLLRGAALAAGLLVAAACTSGGGETGTTGSGGSGGTPLTPTGFSCTGKKVSYKTDVAPLLAAHCAGVEGCHVTMHDPDSAYALLVSKANDECADDQRELVVPGDPEHSYAIQKMTDKNVCSGSPMPKPFQEGSAWTKLPDPLIQTIYDWVCQGAKKD